MQKVSLLNALEFIAARGNLVFSVEFRKRTDGKLRKMNCRLDVTKYLTKPREGPEQEQGVTIDSKGLIHVYDMVKKGYRCFAALNLTQICMHGEWFEVEQDMAFKMAFADVLATL